MDLKRLNLILHFILRISKKSCSCESFSGSMADTEVVPPHGGRYVFLSREGHQRFPRIVRGVDLSNISEASAS